MRSGHTNHAQASIFLKIKACDYQLVKHDSGCQNIFGQNKGWQR
jgi:hypothetical protein